jgi:hypothetical protein
MLGTFGLRGTKGPERPETMGAAEQLGVRGFEGAQAKFDALVRQLEGAETARMSHSELETMLEKEGREMLRQLLQAHLDRRAGATAQEPVVGADGVERTHRRPGERKLETVLGEVTVHREGYGARGEETLYPLDGELNLPKEKYSLGVRRRAAEEAAKGSYDEAVRVLKAHTGAEVAKRQVEEVVQRAAGDFLGFYLGRRIEWQGRAATSGSILVLTFDAKGVPTRKEDLRPQTKALAEKRSHKLEKRLSKGEKLSSKRMAQVAAVYTIAPFVREPEHIIEDLARKAEDAPKRPRPEGKRVWASLKREPEEVIDEAFLDACSRDGKRTKDWVVLVDGNESQLRLVQAAAKENKRPVTIVLDVIHVLEYLWEASYVFHAEGTQGAQAWVTEKLLWLLCGEAGQVIGSIRRSATKQAPRSSGPMCPQIQLTTRMIRRGSSRRTARWSAVCLAP